MPSPTTAQPRAAYVKALAGVLCCLAFAFLLYHSLAGGTLLAHSVYDSYALQAENWLQGRNYIAGGENYTWLELAIYGGRYYQSFPPVPAVLLVPWVLAFGSAAAVPSNLVAVLAALGIAAGVFCCFWQRKASPATAAFFAVFCVAGSGVFWLGCSGGVWFLAQLFGLLFAVWGLFFALQGGVAATVLTSLCFALAVGCRPFYAALGLVWGLGLLVQIHKKQAPPALLLPAVLPAALVAAALMAYNFTRFGSVLEFGHNYLPEFVQAADGQFSLAYLWPNFLKLLRPVTLDSALQLHFEIFNGFLFWQANPLFLLAILCGLAALWRRQKPEPHTYPLPGGGAVLAALCFGLTLLTCTHRTLGGWQFGARYMVDLFPYVLLYFLARPHWQPRTGALTLCGMAVLFNQCYGPLYMLQT